MRLSHSIQCTLAVTCCLLMACQSEAGSTTRPSPSAAPVVPAAQPVASTSPTSCDALPKWRPETLALPPAWGPTLPPGIDELRFAPGMFDAEADDFFSYVFVLSWTEKGPAQPDEIRKLLQDYYAGLLSLVGKEKGISLKPEQITVRMTPNPRDRPATDPTFGYIVEADIIDAFVTGKPLQLKLELHGDASCMHIAASPQSSDHPVWMQLRQQLSCLPCPTP